MRVMPQAITCIFHHVALFLAAIALHLLIAYFLYGVLFDLNPVAPKPQLITDSLELLIAETDAELPTEATAPQLPANAPRPVPREAAYLVAPDAPIDLTPPDLDPELPDLPQPMEWTPPMALSSHMEVTAELPEITLPPPEPLPLPDAPAQEAAGATARQDPPRLTTDIQTYLRKHYPKEARRKGWEGRVVLKLTIADDGAVSSVEIHTSSGYASLDRAALKMMRAARYTHGPAELLQHIEYKLK